MGKAVVIPSLEKIAQLYEVSCQSNSSIIRANESPGPLLESCKIFFRQILEKEKIFLLIIAHPGTPRDRQLGRLSGNTDTSVSWGQAEQPESHDICAGYYSFARTLDGNGESAPPCH